MIAKFMTFVMAIVFMSNVSLFANEGMPTPVGEPSAPAVPAENMTQGAPTTSAVTTDSGAGKEVKKREPARRRHKRKNRKHRRSRR